MCTVHCYYSVLVCQLWFVLDPAPTRSTTMVTKPPPRSAGSALRRPGGAEDVERVELAQEVCSFGGSLLKWLVVMRRNEISPPSPVRLLCARWIVYWNWSLFSCNISHDSPAQSFPYHLCILSSQVSSLKATVQDMEKERDFYFGKLRSIEVICQEVDGEADTTMQKILDVLYATDVSVTSQEYSDRHVWETPSSAFLSMFHNWWLSLVGNKCSVVFEYWNPHFVSC